MRFAAVSRLLFPLLACAFAAPLGCQPTPDYRITVHDIPADAALVLLAWKGSDDAAPKNSLVVPVAQLSADERASYTMGLAIEGAPEDNGTISVATVDKNFCFTSVVSSDEAARSSSGHVTTIDIELDPRQNANVVERTNVPSPPVKCPPNPPFPDYPDPVACAKLPGLTAMPTEPTLIPTQPVVMNTLRQLRGPAREFDGGELSFFGWGFDHPALNFSLVCDPTKCFPDLAMKYPMYASKVAGTMGFSYPNLIPRSYSQLDLPVTQLKASLNIPDPDSGFQDGVVLCIAVSAIAFSVTNPDGKSASFSEVLPRN